MNRKAEATPIELLIRVIIMVLCIYLVFKFGGNIAGIFGGSNTPAQFEDFVSEVNGMGIGQKVLFLQLDEETAAFGFTKGNADFRCVGCYMHEMKSQAAYSSIFKTWTKKRPSNPECRDKACACLCTKGLSEVQSSGTEIELQCANMICSTIDGDLLGTLNLEEALKKKIIVASYPSFENGFMFARFSQNKPLIGTTNRKSSACVKKEAVNEQIVVSVYPGDCTIQK